MRFVHTADWHLGRLFHGVHLTDDQRHALLQLVDLVKCERPDAVIIAGDIYDRAIPPPEAVDLLDEILCRLVLDIKVPVILIAGNHDSPNRLNFGSRLLSQRRLYVTGTLTKTCTPLTIEDGHGPVTVYPVPYAEPMVVRECLGCDDVNDHDSAMSAIVAGLRSVNGGGTGRSILVGHAFVAGGAECESERPLSVGGAGTVDLGRLAGFDYVALGHLHCPQSLNGGSIRYSGSLLKYSFDEADQKKGVYLVEMDGDGACDVRSIHLTARRDVRRIEGTMAQLLAGPSDGKCKDDYLEALVTDVGPVLDAMPRLRQVYPNVMHIRRPEAALGATLGDRPDIRGKSALQLFSAFYRHVTDGDLSTDQEAALVEIAARAESEAREAGA